jgi:hypothetical protein
MADDLSASGDAANNILDGLQLRSRDLEQTAKRFSSTMSQAFTSSIAGGRDFDGVLKSLTLRLSDLALKMAFKPLPSRTTSCLVPESRGAILTRESEEALWQTFFTAAPAQRREFEPSSKRRKRRPAVSPAGTA